MTAPTVADLAAILRTLSPNLPDDPAAMLRALHEAVPGDVLMVDLVAAIQAEMQRLDEAKAVLRADTAETEVELRAALLAANPEGGMQ